MDSPRTSYNFHNNCIDYLRLYAAITIVLGHCVRWLTPNTNALYEIASHILIFPGLMILFCLSGYLICASLERSKNAQEYLWKRFTRLYPGLWFAFGVSLLAVSIMTTMYNIPVGFSDWSKWIIAQLTIFQFYTPPALKQYGIGNPNGVLWTIPIEIFMYFFILLFYKKMKNWHWNTWGVFLSCGIILNIISDLIFPHLPLLAGKILFVSPIPYFYTFGIGMFVYNFREKAIPFLEKKFYILLFLYATWVISNRYIIHFNLGLYLNIVEGVGVCLLTMGAMYKFGKHRIAHDYSYSIYLYHEIFINIILISSIPGFTNTWAAVGIVYVCTVICAILSCHLVEEPSSRFLKRIRF